MGMIRCRHINPYLCPLHPPPYAIRAVVHCGTPEKPCSARLWEEDERVGYFGCFELNTRTEWGERGEAASWKAW